MPLIEHMMFCGATPVFAGSPKQIDFIKKSFPQIEAHELGGYDIRYAQNKWLTRLRLAWQSGSIFQSVKAEQQWLQLQADALALDGIISDNRFGLYHTQIPSVIITHQINVMSGWGRMGDHFTQKQNKRWLQKFQQQWIVDIAEEPYLAGKLAHPAWPASKYIGWLSPYGTARIDPDKKQHILILLSGPEPQRSTLSKQLFSWACRQTLPIVFIEGSDDVEKRTIPQHITYHKRVVPAAIVPLMQQAKFAICRSGYSTLMDLLATNTPAFMIPTKGQAEQEYLATYLDGRMGLKHLKSIAALDQEVAPFNAHAAAPGNWILFKPILEDWLCSL